MTRDFFPKSFTSTKRLRERKKNDNGSFFLPVPLVLDDDDDDVVVEPTVDVEKVF